MKRQILSLATAMALTAGGAVFAQSTLNTPAPGPSQETKPGQTNNNLQNPGSNMQKPATPPVRENGSPEGTAAESNARTNGQTTGTTTTTTTPTDTTTGTMNNDTTGTATGTTGTTGTMNNDTTGTATGSSTTGTYNSTTGTTTGSSMDNTSSTTSTRSSRLPKTASDLPTVALIGLLALSAFFAVRVYAKRNA